MKNETIYTELTQRFDAAFAAAQRAASLTMRLKYDTWPYKRALALFYSFNGRAAALAKLRCDLSKITSGDEPGL